jgi:hypothetical protein
MLIYKCFFSKMESRNLILNYLNLNIKILFSQFYFHNFTLQKFFEIILLKLIKNLQEVPFNKCLHTIFRILMVFEKSQKVKDSTVFVI